MAELKVVTMEYLIDKYGSIRRLMRDYWHGKLTPEEELCIEDCMRPETRIGMKPVV